MKTHAHMAPAEIESCTCDECGRMDAALGIGEAMAEIEHAVESLPMDVMRAGHDGETYLTVMRFVADFYVVRSLLIGQVDA